MRKIASILILTFFLITNSGMAITIHWCKGKVSAVSIFSSNSSCGCGKKAKKPKCCEEHTTLLKATNVFSKTETTESKVALYLHVLLNRSEHIVTPSRELKYRASDFLSHPPNSSAEDLTLLYQALLI